MSDQLKAEKRRLREVLKATRRALRTREQDQLALDEALGALRLDRGALVAVYAALPDEASVDRLAKDLRRTGRSTAYPRVTPLGLLFCVCGPEDLSPGKMGILEPPESFPTVRPAAIDVFFIPGLGFTRRGERIGYGGGYYDRALAAADAERMDPALKFGVCFEVQVQTRLPVDHLDVRMHAVVTERGVFFAAR